MNTYPAFPVLPNGNNNVDNYGFKIFAYPGMTLLDWFAGKALQGLLSAPSDTISQDSGPNARANPAKASEWAYQQAEAMLKYRENIKWT
jgi:hypothetical protein